MLTVDLNCDMGESTKLWPYSIDKDLALIECVSSVNLACGYHAGDPSTIHQLVEASLKKGIAIGAHPSYPDRENFGRTSLSFPPGVIYDQIIYQIGALAGFLKIHGAKLHHVKPHGALYNDAAKDAVLAKAIVDAVYDFDPSLLLYGLSGSELIKTAREKGLATGSEAFADRTYQPEGTLTPRNQEKALITDEATALQQVLYMIQEGKVKDIHGHSIPLLAETICIHGDGPKALQFAEAIRQMLNRNNILVRPLQKNNA